MPRQQHFDNGDGEEDRKWIVGAGLGFERRADTRAQAQAARMDKQEHCGGIGRCNDRSDQQGFKPREMQKIKRHRRHDGGGDDDADGCQDQGRRENAADRGIACTQAAIEQDQGERDGPHEIGHAHIVELDAAGAGFAGQHADREEAQQQGGAKPQGNQA